jgi:hypothetical protein
MKDLEDFEIEDRATHTGAEDEGEGRGDRRTLVVAAVVVVAIALTVAVWLTLRSPRPTEEPGTAADSSIQDTLETSVAEDREPLGDFELPALDASDAIVRQMAATLSAHPDFVAWLVSDDLIRRFAVVVANVAEGESPRSHLGFMAPAERFATSGGAADGIVIDRDSYNRFDALVEAFESLDIDGSVELYRRFEPLLDEAYRELGYPAGSFETALRKAIDIVLKTPRIEGDIGLEPGVRSFKFADDRLEGLDPVQKQLVRMGPRNVASVQAKMRAFLEALEDSSSALPG